jgi:hypothetical protein
MKIKNMLLLLFISASALPAQNKVWQIKLASGDMLSNVSLQNVVGDSLAISQTGQARRIAVDAIVEMRRAGKSKFWKGAGIGFLAGGVTGGLIAAATYEKPKNDFEAIVEDIFATRQTNIVTGALLGGISGFIIGGLIGSSAGKEQVYDFTQKTREQKSDMLRFIVAR